SGPMCSHDRPFLPPHPHRIPARERGSLRSGDRRGGGLSTSARMEYQLGPRLGEGAFGEVYRATMRSSSGIEQQVAVKLLHPDIAPTAQPVERLRDEGKILASLQHPVILRVHDL